MIDVEQTLRDELNKLSAPVPPPDWQAVLTLAAVSGHGRLIAIVPEAALEQRLTGQKFARRRFRIAFVLAACAVAILTAAAFATGLTDRFSAWINGTPGKPAPSSVQNGFSARNEVSLASFAQGTKLRLLLRKTVSGTSFDLLGFRNGDAYCLRLVRTDVPGAPGRTQCLRAAELQGHVALVADNSYFSVGKPAITITGVYGFAADNVGSIHIIRTRNPTTVPVRNNVFLALHGQLQGAVQHHLPPDTVLALTAELKNGTLRNIPYVVEGAIPGGILPGGKLPTVPSYFAPPGSRVTPGAPTHVTATITDPRIGWLAQREKLGKPLPKQRFLQFSFGRVIQPDPDDPIRLGLAIGKASGFTHGHAVQGNWTCLLDFEALGNGAGAGCTPKPFQNGPISSGGYTESPITHFNGLAADGITRLTVFLSTGQHVPAALRDNVYSVAVPEADLPGEIVGYNQQGKVAGILKLQGNPVAKPCPPAGFSTPTSQLPATQKWERLDLATLAVNGQTILGKTPTQVQAILGRPALIRPRNQAINGIAIPAYYYGGTTQATLGLDITFAKRGPQIVANNLFFQAPSLRDAKLGPILRLQPGRLQQRITATYGKRYRLTTTYGGSQLTCTASFQDRASAKGISIGLNPYRPSRPYLDISANGG